MILVLALVVLFASIVIVAKKMKDRNIVAPAETGQQSINMFGSEKVVGWATFTGNVSLIAEKKLTVKKESGEMGEVGIHGATPVMIKEADGRLRTGQIADVRIGDFVTIQYDETDQSAKMIVIGLSQ